MIATKEQIERGIGLYFDTEVAPKIDSSLVKIALSVKLSGLLGSGKLMQWAEAYLPEYITQSADGYELEGLSSALQNAMKKYGKLEIEVPQIFTIPGFVLKFSAKDVKKLTDYIGGQQ